MSDQDYLHGLLNRPVEEAGREGQEKLSCAHHPNLRWERRKFDPRRISNNPHLMFLGDLTSGLSGHPIGAQYGDGVTHAIECSCPYSDLVVVEEGV
jgi:hypothetical protein